MKRATFVGLLMLTGCGGDMPVYIPALHDNFENNWLVDYTVDKYFGMSVERMPEWYGSVKIDFVSTDDEIQGVSLDDDGCKRLVRSSPDEVTLAHEFGHAYGLEHVSDVENLMHVEGGVCTRARPDTALSAAQLDEVRFEAGLVDACWLSLSER
jgi:hypothetical protein